MGEGSSAGFTLQKCWLQVARQPTKHKYTHASELSCRTRVTQDERMRVKGGRKRDTVFAHDCMKPCNMVTGTNSMIIFYWETCSRSIFSLSKERYDIKKPATTQCAWNREQRASSQTMWFMSHAWYKRRHSVLKTVQLPDTSVKRTSTVPWEDNAQLNIQHK